MSHKLSILISTHQDGIFNIPQVIKIKDRRLLYVVVHQVCNENKEKYESFINDCLLIRDDVTVISDTSTGVTKSRNLAINNCKTKIALFSDDDVIFEPSFVDDIISKFEKTDSAAITFMALEKDSGKPLKKYPELRLEHNKKTILNVGTIEVAVNVRTLIDNDIYFPEYLGAGNKYPVCDEPVFLSYIINKGLSVKYEPIAIVRHPLESSGKSFDTYEKIVSRGIAFKEIFGGWSFLIILIFFLKNINMFKLGRLYSLKAIFDGWLLQRDLNNNDT